MQSILIPSCSDLEVLSSAPASSAPLKLFANDVQAAEMREAKALDKVCIDSRLIPLIHSRALFVL
jgi:hypothetical protein